MFSFSGEKIVALNRIGNIETDFHYDPLVVTSELKPVSTERVFMVFGKTRKGRDVIRVYPLQRVPDKPYPAFSVSPIGAKELDDKTTHRCFVHKDFVIVRTLSDVIMKAEDALKRRDLDYLPLNLLTLIKHCYFNDLLDDSFIASVEKDFTRVEKLLARTRSNFVSESRVSAKLAVRTCERILLCVKEVIEKNGN
jgi:hypothetical protein